MMRKAIIFSLCFILLALFAVHFYISFKKVMASYDVKEFAEQRIGELFDVRLRIGNVKIGLFRDVSLSGFQVSQPLSQKFFYLVDIKKVVLRFSLFSFLKTSVASPNTIFLYTPKLEFNRFEIPFALLANGYFLRQKHVSLNVREGKIEYVFPQIATKFLLEHINGVIRPLADSKVELKFKAKGGGDLTGSISVDGIYDQKRETCEVDVSLHDLAVVSSSSIPIENLNGAVHITDDTITIGRIVFYVRDIPVEVKGTISNYAKQPVFDLHFAIRSKHGGAKFTIFDRYPNLKIEGDVNIADYAYTYKGDVILQESGFSLQNLRINDDYTSAGDFMFNTGVYTMFFKKENQEVRCQVLHTNYNMRFDLNINHVQFLGYDFVVVGRVELEPDISFWRDERLVLHGTIETDYMIFNYTPLKDFKGTFTISPEAVRNVHFLWGNVYDLKGDMSLEEPRSIDAEFTVTALDLERCEAFGGFVIPDDIEGKIHSRVTIVGPAKNPQIEGYLRSGPGKFQDFSFKKLTVDFFGDRYLLNLRESKIHRSNSVFYVKGKIDFTKKNIFHDLYVESSERLVLWRGWDLSKSVSEDVILLKKKVTDNIDLKVQGALRSDKTEEEPSSEGAVSLQYQYEDDASVSFSYEDEDDDETVSVKHTINF